MNWSTLVFKKDIIVFLLGFCCACNIIGQKSDVLFEELNSDQTKITFSNDVQENLSSKENLFDFDYFYNGAGVGVADLNNDGLQDVIFSANQKPNEIYINLGDFKFEKLSDPWGKSLLQKGWSNGISIADVNNDGYQDIYISQGGPHIPSKRKNLLYINNGDLTFTESADSYGLADSGISTQSAFFDFDRDGDLDCIVMNESEYYGLDPISFYQALGEDEQIFWQNCSHFYINENGKFKDATNEVGLLKPSFGLGLAVSDLNNDGWLDIYIANDYYIPDAMYINQKDGSFKDEVKERTDQLSFYGMGVDVADINNDGHKDIFVLDMASSDHYRSKTLMRSMNVSNFRLLVNTLQFPHQYMFNSLQLGDGNNKFFNVAQYGGVAKTDWSWSVLMNDFDLDGKKDIFITNGYRRYALDNDFQNEVLKTKKAFNGNVPLSEKKKLYESMPTEPLANIVYQNLGGAAFSEKTKSWGLDKPTFSNGAAVADLDNDGDLDLIINNIDKKASIYRNQAIENKIGNYLTVKDADDNPFIKVTIDYEGGSQFMESKRVRGYMSSSQALLHFGLGDTKMIETLTVTWPDGSRIERKNVKPNQTLELKKPKKHKPNTSEDEAEKKMFTQVDPLTLNLGYTHQENNYDDFKKEILLPYQQSTLGPNVINHDINKDGLEDLFVLGASGQANQLYIQNAQSWELLELPIFEEDSNYEDLDAVFFDLNSDGWDDIYMVTGGNKMASGDEFYKDRIYINKSGKGFERYESILLDGLRYSGKSGKAIDFDNDGDDDLLIGNRIIPQMYPYAAPSYLFENVNGELQDVTITAVPELNDFGIINDIEIVDLNSDGFKDFIVAGEWNSIGLFIYENGQFKNRSDQFGLDKMRGWWYSVTSFNANDDGRPDFVIGNIGTNSKYKASELKPLRVYAGDLDSNGTWDLVLSKKYKGNYVPFRGKECSTQQMPFIGQKFPTYDLFATASIDDVYGAELKDSYESEVNTFKSIAFISDDNNGYIVKELPASSQYSPIIDAESYNDKLILSGNIYNTEVETPRLDMGRGVVLHYDKKKNLFQEILSNHSGLYLQGNVKAVTQVYHKGQNSHFVIATVNNGTLKIFKENKSH